MKKITIVFLCFLMLAGALAGCAGEVTEAPLEVSFTTEPSNTILLPEEATLLGGWRSGSLNGPPQYDFMTQAYEPYLFGTGHGWIFNEDGTFVCAGRHSVTTNGVTMAEQHAYTGNYEVDGDTIQCTNVTRESWLNGMLFAARSDPESAVDDFSFQFSIGIDEAGEYFTHTFSWGEYYDALQNFDPTEKSRR